MKSDLIVLVPDNNIEKTIDALLKHRRKSLHIRELSFEIIRHPGTDGGVRKKAHTLLRGSQRRFDNAIAIFDYHGCGMEEEKSAEEIESFVVSNLVSVGWENDDVLVVVIEPELETWVWNDSPWVARILAQENSTAKVAKSLLAKQRFHFNELGKPDRPKEAMEFVLRQKSISRSSAIFEEMAKKVSLRKCKDRAFLKLREFLHRKFPETD